MRPGMRTEGPMPHKYASMKRSFDLDRREFARLVGGAAAAGGLVLGVPALGGEGEKAPAVETNIEEFLKVPRTAHSLPGPFPGKVVKVTDERSLAGDAVDGKVVGEMFERGVRALTGRNMAGSFAMLFSRDDVVGLKVNPVGAPLIHTKPELAEAVIRWLVDNRLPKRNIVIWDRFDYMLKDAGFTRERFPDVGLEGLQTMDEEGNRWRDANGVHAKPARGETLLVSVAMVFRNCRS